MQYFCFLIIWQIHPYWTDSWWNYHWCITKALPIIRMICKIFFDFGSFLIGNNFTPLSIYTLAPYLNLHFGCKSFFQKDPLSNLLSFFPKLLSITAIFLCIFRFDINNLPISYTILRNPVTYLKHLPALFLTFFLMYSYILTFVLPIQVYYKYNIK